MKTEQGFAAPIAVIVILVLLGAGAYVALKNRGEMSGVCTLDAKICPDGSHVSRVGPSCEFAACPAGDEEQTSDNNPVSGENIPADWQTYKSGNFGYTIKYPPDWSYKFPDSEIVCFGKEIKIVEQNIEGGRPTRCEGDHILIYVTPGAYMTDSNFEETIAIRRESNPNVEVRRFKIDGVNAITIYNQGEKYTTAETFFSRNRDGYTVSLSLTTGQNDSLWRAHLESMLSTFKFIE